jgi:hypothetical protein
MLLAARQLSAAIGKALITLPTCHLGVDTLAEVNLNLQHTTTESNRHFPHILHVGLLCYSLQEFFSWSEVLTGTQKLRA